MTSDAQIGAVAPFSEPTRAWFDSAFAAPTDAQVGAWQAIERGRHTLVVAPTGSGKTLAAFLWSIDRLVRERRSARADADLPEPATAAAPGVRILYVSPMKALGVDVERNLRAPLIGIGQAAERLGETLPPITVGVRSGDTTPKERRRLVTHPPDVLITTPESLYLMLTSKAAETLRTVHTVIVDEIHALADDKRGAHLALSLERLEGLLETPPQRIGLSATVRPIDAVARFLGGSRPVQVVAPDRRRRFDLTVEVPVDDMSNPPMPESVAPAGDRGEGAASRGPAAVANDDGEHRVGSMWPAIEASLLKRIRSVRSAIVFANSRRLAERVTARLNELDVQLQSADDEVEPLARVHHGSVSKDQRAEVEEALKSGRLRCVVATSSLELGIDMGLVDLVVQIDAPPSVASGLQRVGRAGHQVAGISRAVFYPTHRQQLLETAIVTERMLAGEIEHLHMPANPLDVLAQQTVAAASVETLDVEAWFATVRRAAPFASLPRSAYVATLDLLSGRYPSSEFAELRPRVLWDRDAQTLEARPGAKRLAITSGGTIPDRGLFRVVAVTGDEGGGTRVGELDEEMVYESRVGDVFTLGTTSWRIREMTHDRVNVVPAFGQPGRMPFWRGDSAARPAELGEALGEMLRGLEDDGAAERLQRAGLDRRAVQNALAYLAEQREATGMVPTDRALTVERTRDDVGDWRLVLESPYGQAVHAPWALAVTARVREQLGIEGSAIASNDGIIVRIPDTESTPPGAELFVFDPDEIRSIVTAEVSGSALFAARFRECAARALLLGASKPGSRSPLWQQRQRSARLLEIAARHPQFPIVLETVRECLQDVYDIDALVGLMQRVDSRRVRLREVACELPSPFARSMLFGYVGEFMYEGDQPLGERRIAALTVDPQLLRELLGEVELRELLDPEAVTDVEAELQRTAPAFRVHGVEGVADLLRMLGPLSAADVHARLAEASPAAAELLGELENARRVIRVRIAGAEVWAAVEDAGLLRDALGTALPVGVADAHTQPVSDPLRELVVRWAATNGPFTAAALAAHFGLGTAVVRGALERLVVEGLLLRGRFRPQHAAAADVDDDVEWVHRDVLRRLRSRSLAKLRGSIEPVPQHAFAMFLSDWQGCSNQQRGLDGLLSVIEQLAGLPLAASTLETMVLPQRVADYTPAMLDELIASGQVLWVGEGELPGHDGRVSLHLADTLDLTRQTSDDSDGSDKPSGLSQLIADVLGDDGALFAHQLRERLIARGAQFSTEQLAAAVWELAWAGAITTDSLGPLRATVSGTHAAQKTRTRPSAARSIRRGAFARVREARAHDQTVGEGDSSMRTGAAHAAATEPRLAGRWALVPHSTAERAERLSAQAGLLLDRYGVVTRGSVMAEGFPGGFAQVYQLLAEFERGGYCRRGYLIDGLGGAQFAASGTVDRLREFADLHVSSSGQALTLSATDPANPFGAALPWPEAESADSGRPKRNPGALVTIVDGEPVLYLERGGRTAVSFVSAEAASADDPAQRQTRRDSAARSLVETVQSRHLATFTVLKIDGEPVGGSVWRRPLIDAGFEETPRGLILRRRVR